MVGRRKSTTMREVAHLAEVSIQTVSDVVNERPGISEETRARVWAAVDQVGYRPFSIARSLRTRRTRTLAFLVPDIDDICMATMTSAAEDCAQSHGYNLVVFNSRSDHQREAAYMQVIIDRWIDGVMFASSRGSLANVDTLEDAGVPTVSVDRGPERPDRLSVTYNHRLAGRMAAEHLMDLGHTRIAHIGGPPDSRIARERCEGFRQAIAKRNLTPGACLALPGNWQCETGYQAMQQILAADVRPTAVFSCNDRMAFGAIRAAYEAGLKVPEDVSIIGLDDIEVAAYQIPPLTTIRQPFTEMGTLSTELLLNKLEGGPIAQPQIMLQPTLVLRRSTMPPQRR
jgi:LacI family transcriptional regulator